MRIRQSGRPQFRSNETRTSSCCDVTSGNDATSVAFKTARAAIVTATPIERLPTTHIEYDRDDRSG
jgi:hypothetical protein